MKKLLFPARLLPSGGVCLLFLAANSFAQKQEDLKLWYNKPSDDVWENALPIGNGFLGAMVYGNVDTETIQLNEYPVWSGSPNRNNPIGIRFIGRNPESVEGKIKFKGIAKFKLTGGSLSSNDTSLTIKNTSKEIIYISIGTNFINYHDIIGGENTNSFYQTKKIATPIISEKAKITLPDLKPTFVYDIPTGKGKTYTMVLKK